MRLPQMAGLQDLHSLLRPQGIKPISAGTKQLTPHQPEGALQKVVFLRPNGRQLSLALPLEGLGGKGRIAQDISDQVQGDVKVGAQDFRVKTKTVVAGVGFDAASCRLNCAGDFLRRPARGPFDQHLGHQLSNAIPGGVLAQDAAAAYGAELHEGKPVILFDQEAQPVGQLKLVNGVLRERFDVRSALWRPSFRHQRVKRFAVGRQIMTSDALQIGGRDTLNGSEVAIRESQVVGCQPVGAEILGLALHRFADGQRAGDKLFHCLLQLTGFDGSRLHSFHLGEEGRGGGIKICGVQRGADAQESRVPRVISPGMHGVHQTLSFPHLTIKAGTASAAEERSQNIENRHVGMAQLRGVPGKVQISQFNGRLFDHLARRCLRRFLGQDKGGDGAGSGSGIGFLDLLNDGAGSHVAGHDVEHVVGGILLVVVSSDILRLQLVEDVRIADHGKAVGAPRVGSLEQAPPRPPVRVIHVHVHFAADDFHFLGQLVRRQRGVLHDIAQNVQSHGRAGAGNINVKDGAVKGGVGIHVAPRLLHLLINAAARAAGGAFEQHVLEHVRKPRPQPSSLVDAPRHAPCLGGHHGSTVILPENDRQSVFQCRQPHTGRHGGEEAGRSIRQHFGGHELGRSLSDPGGRPGG